jgi:hypothetical protein
VKRERVDRGGAILKRRVEGEREEGEERERDRASAT